MKVTASADRLRLQSVLRRQTLNSKNRRSDEHATRTEYRLPLAARMKMKVPVLLAVAVALAACGSTSAASPSADALARGAAVKTLAAGKLDSLPTGQIYIRMIRFAQPAGYVIHSKQHVPSVVYVETGVHQLVLNGEAPIDLQAGQAAFHQSVAHTHFNPGPAPSVWYSIALWPSSARGQPLVDPIARAAFESEDIVRDELPQVAYSQVLRQVTLAMSGTTGAHRFGGLYVFYVLSGSLTVRSDHRSAVTVSAGQGLAFLPDVGVQQTNAGQGPAVFLEFITTAVGKSFDVPLPQPPAA
jgi:quercetin dioxygenase-like cupin family protein